MSQGSGFFISEDGYVVTNNHVGEGESEITVIADDGEEYPAKLIGTDDRTDLALLKVDGDGFKFAKLSQEEPKIGQWVLAVGNPFGLGGTVTAGIISAEGRDIGAGPYDDFLQIDAPVNRGNSGGPTFNTKGEVVGVNTAIFSPSGGNVGIAFAIPAATVQEIVTDLKDDGTVTRGWLGVQIQPVTEDIAASLGIDSTDGAIVADAQEDGPAAGAGIEAGDIITEVNGKTVKDPKELSETIARIEPKQRVTVTVLRDGRERDIDVTLGNLKDLDTQMQANADRDNDRGDVQPGSLDGLGLTVEENPDGEGVVVRGVADESPASQTGLQPGDIITAIGGESVQSVSDVEDGISAAQKQGRDAVLLKVQGENGTRFVGVPFERG
jgi:serine protease Do